jgi:hypothetical protein
MSRALTDNLAKAGHDYFEVVFYNSTATPPVVARASWELGDAAGIKNVSRGYAYESAPGVPDASKAILFVGRKADKTLLAVGRLTKVDNSTTDLTITPTSTTATFTVAALTAGADPNQSGFDAKWDASELTNVAAPTGFPPTFATGGTGGAAPSKAATKIMDMSDTNPGTAVFPLYNILANEATVQATYTIGSTAGFGAPGGAANAWTFTGGIYPYLPGIKIAAIPPAIQPKIPRYPRGGGLYYYAPAPHALSTTITITNNNGVDAVFDPTTEFDITTAGASDREGVISFCFDIPVYAINSDPMTGGPDALTWHIRPGFGTNQYDLDNGKGSAGGSILLGVGNDLTLNWLWVEGAP